MAIRFLTGLDSNFNEKMGGIAGRAGQGMMTGVGGSIAGLGKAIGNERLAGVDFRPEGVKLKERFGQLTGSEDPNDRQELLQVMGKMGASPDVIAKYQMQFAEEERQRKATSESITSSTETRASIAKQIRATNPDLAQAVIDEQASGQSQALNAALDIIKDRSKPSTGETDPSLVKEFKFAVQKGYKGTFQEFIQSKKSPLVSTVTTPKQRKLESNLERQEAMYDSTSEAAPANILKGQNARRVLKTVNDGIATGAFPEFVANQSSAFQGFLQKFGIPVPEGLASNVLQQSELKKIQVDGMLPFIEEQSRGWTDADRENYFRTSAGFTQPWQYNEVVALTDLQNAVDGLDKNQFAYSRAKLDTVTDLDGDTLYADYLKHLPRTKVIADFKRGDLTYDKLEVIDDGANLSQYWVESIPTGFVLEKPNGELIDMSWEDINATALDRGQTAREFLAQQELKGSIKKAL